VDSCFSYSPLREAILSRYAASSSHVHRVLGSTRANIDVKRHSHRAWTISYECSLITANDANIQAFVAEVRVYLHDFLIMPSV
jgi:hypothetical protein